MFRLIAVGTLVLVHLCSHAQDAPAASLELSCPTSPFISVSASSPDLDAIPSVRLSLQDPSGRIQGFPVATKTIPKSSYGAIAELPKHPQRSKALALEICDAQQGEYHLVIAEFGNAPYRLNVRADAKAKNGESLILQNLATEGRNRSYKFVFRIRKDRLELMWLDKNRTEKRFLQPAEW